MPAPIVAFVGHSNSGKTTFLEKLIPELKKRGYRVAVVKHVPGHLSPLSERDSDKLLVAGSDTVVIDAPEKLVITSAQTQESSLESIALFLGESFDIILAEGFKTADVPKIIFTRAPAGELPTNLSRVSAVISDEPIETKTQQFGTQDVVQVADFLERGFILPAKNRVSLIVNGENVILGNFPRKMLSTTIEAMAKSLKDINSVNNLEFRLKKISD